MNLLSSYRHFLYVSQFSSNLLAHSLSFNPAEPIYCSCYSRQLSRVAFSVVLSRPSSLLNKLERFLLYIARSLIKVMLSSILPPNIIENRSALLLSKSWKRLIYIAKGN